MRKTRDVSPRRSAVSEVSRGGLDRRLVLTISAVLFADTMFYAAIAPLLPELVRELHLSKLSAGVMTASYPLGTLLASLPAGVAATRLGGKATVLAGLAMLAGSTIAFAFLQNAAALDAARFVEGVGGAFSWTGGLAMLIDAAPSEQRGAVIGRALAAAVAGALVGPVIGTLAAAAGRPLAFSAVVVIVALLIVAVRRLPAGPAGLQPDARTALRAFGDRDVLAAMWLILLPALVAGAVDVLAPLRLYGLGVSAVGVGAAFLLAAAVEASVSPLVGRLSDRRGRLPPLRAGLLLASALLLCFTLPRSPWLLAGLVVLMGAALGAVWTPALALLSDACERRGLGQGLVGALTNLAWAGGMILGSAGGGGVARSTGDGLSMAITAALCLGTVAVIFRIPSPAGVAGIGELRK